MAQTSEASRERLGRELSRARKAAGRTQTEAGAVIRCGQGKIAKVEGAAQSISRHDLDELMHYYKLSELKQAGLRELHRNSAVPRAASGRLARSKAFAKLVSVETDATEILSWHSERIPGPLQHTHYMLKQFQLDQPGKRNSVRSALVERKSRLNIFTVDQPPRYRVVLSESSLYRLPGGCTPTLAEDQIRNLLELLTQYPQFELRILLFTAPLAYADSDFAVLRFAHDEVVNPDDFVYLEHVGGAHTVKTIDKFTKYWDLLAAASLSRDKTVAFLQRCLDELISGDHPGWPR